MKRFASPAGQTRILLSMAGEIRHLLDVLSRRALASLAFAATAASALDVAARETLRASPLFSIGRSKNANVVRYQARFSSRGLEPARPIDAFWHMLADALLPSVQHLDLFGVTLDGAPLSERLRSH